ncbi:MAG: hypothetical protein D3914_07970 [Candidatus Electrothrix sp. LOE2]|nr:hypothetical protein [Candidatus Electrothrix sp. LOE2]
MEKLELVGMRHLSAKDDITGGKRQAFFREREGIEKKQGAQCAPYSNSRTNWGLSLIYAFG